MSRQLYVIFAAVGAALAAAGFDANWQTVGGIGVFVYGLLATLQRFQLRLRSRSKNATVDLNFGAVVDQFTKERQDGKPSEIPDWAGGQMVAITIVLMVLCRALKSESPDVAKLAASMLGAARSHASGKMSREARDTFNVVIASVEGMLTPSSTTEE